MTVRQARVADLLLQSKTYRQIAQAVKVGSTRTIHTDVQAVLAFWKAKQYASIDQWVAQELEKIGRVEAEAWEAWARSQADAVSVTEKTGGKEGDTTSETRKGQVGDGRFLDIVLNCVERRAKLLGLNKPDRIELNWREAAERDGVANAGELFEELVGKIATRLAGTGAGGSAGGSEAAGSAAAGAGAL